MGSKVNYQTLSAELDGVLEALQQPDVHVDDAVDLYGQGLKLVAQMEQYLQQAENKLTKLKLESIKAQSDKTP